MAAGYSIRKSAKLAGISYTTVYDWKRTSADFLSAYNEVIDILWVQTKEGIKSLAGQSLKVLNDVMKNKYALDKDKLVAAKAVIGNIHKMVVDDELRRRVEALLDQLEGGANGRAAIGRTFGTGGEGASGTASTGVGLPAVRR